MSFSNYSFSPYRENRTSDWRNGNHGKSYKRQYQNTRQAVQKARSGCRIVAGKKDPGAVYIIGWKVGRHGFRKFIASPPKNGAVSRKSKTTGREWLSCCVTVENISAMTKSTYPGWVDPVNKRVFVNDLNLIMNPVTGFITQFRKQK